MKILIADDREENRLILRQKLVHEGFEIGEARNGREALEKLKAGHYDMIILDLLMPEMDGFQLCYAIKTDPELRKMAVVIYTATYTEPEDEALVRSLGADEFILKPADLEEFIGLIRKLLAAASEGKLGAPRSLTISESEYVKNYMARLLRKLEIKAAEAEHANRELKELNNTLEQRVQQGLAELTEVNRELESFAFTVSHDLRAPLRSIQGVGSILLNAHEGEISREEEKDLLRRLTRSTETMSALIEDLLEYSRIKFSEITLEPVSGEIILDRALELLKRPIEESRAEIVIRRPLGKVMTVEPILVQVFTNLIGNGIKYVAKGVQPRIEVRCEEKEKTVQIWFCDNGIGIREADLSRIFGVFQRLHDNTTYSGTGVGLAIVRRAVQKMGGTVGVSSKLGQGSCFWIELAKAS